jgi:TolA-binding protein
LQEEKKMSKKYMMRRSAITAACLTSMMLAVPAFAAEAAPSAPAPAVAPQTPSKDQQQVQADRKAEDTMRFEDHKKEMLKTLDDHITEAQNRIAEMQKTQSCIKAANDKQAMHACFPDKGHGKWERRGHDGDHAGPAPQPPATQH